MPGAVNRTTMVYKAQRKVEYRYVCEQCENITLWKVRELAMTAENVKRSSPRSFKFNIERTDKELEKTAKQALERLEKMTQALTNILEMEGERYIKEDPYLATRYNEVFNGGAKCPRCKSRQSWYPAFAFKVNTYQYIRNYFLWFLLLSGFISFMLVSNNRDYSEIIHYALASGGMGVLGGLVGLALALSKSRAYRQVKIEPAAIRKPEIIWGEPTVAVEE